MQYVILYKVHAIRLYKMQKLYKTYKSFLQRCWQIYVEFDMINMLGCWKHPFFITAHTDKYTGIKKTPRWAQTDKKEITLDRCPFTTIESRVISVLFCYLTSFVYLSFCRLAILKSWVENHSETKFYFNAYLYSFP